jgi:hypothetical protein
MKNKRAIKAVSSILGTALMLGMAIALFSIVQALAFSFSYNPNPPSARLVGSIDGDTIHVFHHGGESLSLDTKITITIDGDVYVKSAGEILNSTRSNGDNFWNIGEKVSFDRNSHGLSLNGREVTIVVVDVESNSIVMQSTIQE